MFGKLSSFFESGHPLHPNSRSSLLDFEVIYPNTHNNSSWPNGGQTATGAVTWSNCNKTNSQQAFCQFCFKNKEPLFLVRSHNLTDAEGKVTCPALRKYQCPKCKITGDYAHIGKYCPNGSSSKLLQYGQEPIAKHSSTNTNASITEWNNGNQQVIPTTFCEFCFKNKEPLFLVKSHNLKDAEGKVTCPVLRNYQCPKCKVSGDYAHTLKYCPNNHSS